MTGPEVPTGAPVADWTETPNRFGTIGHRSYPRHVDPITLGLRLCRSEDGALAELLKQVPAEYVTDGAVSCRCGETVTPARDQWTFCTGTGCNRVFAVGDDGVWAARLPIGGTE